MDVFNLQGKEYLIFSPTTCGLSLCSDHITITSSPLLTKVPKLCPLDDIVLCCLQMLTFMESFGPLLEKAYVFYYRQ